MTNSSTSATSEPPIFNKGADITYGVFCCLCFVVGTAGNLSSFIYFWTKKKDVSSTLYKFITINDTVICIAVLPAAVPFFADRSPGFLFGHNITCTVWFYVWNVGMRVSIFLVLCLCSTRTYSIIKPFSRLRIWPLKSVILINILLQVAQMIGFHMMKESKIIHSRGTAGCRMVLYMESLPHNHELEVALLFLELSIILTYVVPAFVVATSCIISAILLTKQRQSSHEQSRNRATVTILLFAVVYGVCNVPLLVELIIQTYIVHTDGKYKDFYGFDTLPYQYFHNATWTLLLAANSAVNPVLYFWRMRRFREYVLSGIRMRLCEQLFSGSPNCGKHPSGMEMNRIVRDGNTPTLPPVSITN